MPISPSASLIHALSFPTRPAGTEPNAAVNKADAARAAARAAFQAAQQNKPAAETTAPKPVEPAPASEPGKLRPRGSIVNITV